MTHEDERVAGATVKERIVGRGWELLEPIEAAFERGEIDQAEWHRRIGAIIGPTYLAAADPRWAIRLVEHPGLSGRRRRPVVDNLTNGPTTGTVMNT